MSARCSRSPMQPLDRKQHKIMPNRFIFRRAGAPDWKAIFLFLPIFLCLAEPALAQNLDPLETMLETLVDALTGPIGRLIGILAIVAAGYMMFTGRLNWPIFLMIFFGVVLVFSAATIVDGFATDT